MPLIKMIQVLGTASDSGKSTLAMSLCYYFANKGYKVAPFKAINMSLNSISLNDSSEISRAQWLQAVAAGAEPSFYMNPFLIKPEGMGRSQIIVNGRAIGTMKVNDYYKYLSDNAEKIIKCAIKKLSENYDLIIAEGAGSAAEINMQGRDFANSYVSSLYSTPAILISDIDKGGVFASLYGTVKLMEHSDLVKYMVINRMRGNSAMLASGISKLEILTEKKVAGIIPYSSISLPGEDSMNYITSKNNDKICIIKYPFMENYSDFDPLYLFNIGFTYVDKYNVDALDRCDVIILPGSKLVAEDLQYMEKNGIAEKLISLKGKKTIIGICGGYQMLGNAIRGNNDVENINGEIKGLGLLDIETEYLNEKISGTVNYRLNEKNFSANSSEIGYEIHYGKIVKNGELPLAYIGNAPEGSMHGNIYGTNIHGILENAAFLSHILHFQTKNYRKELMNNIAQASKLFTENMDMNLIEKMVI
ncbi:cobyric acid synthase [Ferroplasma sp.]|uniref:cobyric acid synthase n=1 Tax=Ferroplasma sp. TaxID=2591003 RepID=UPI00307F02AC